MSPENESQSTSPISPFFKRAAFGARAASCNNGAALGLSSRSHPNRRSTLLTLPNQTQDIHLSPSHGTSSPLSSATPSPSPVTGRTTFFGSFSSAASVSLDPGSYPVDPPKTLNCGLFFYFHFFRSVHVFSWLLLFIFLAIVLSSTSTLVLTFEQFFARVFKKYKIFYHNFSILMYFWPIFLIFIWILNLNLKIFQGCLLRQGPRRWNAGFQPDLAVVLGKNSFFLIFWNIV